MTISIISGDVGELHRVLDAYLFAFRAGVAAVVGYSIIKHIMED